MTAVQHLHLDFQPLVWFWLLHLFIYEHGKKEGTSFVDCDGRTDGHVKIEQYLAMRRPRKRENEKMTPLHWWSLSGHPSPD